MQFWPSGLHHRGLDAMLTFSVQSLTFLRCLFVASFIAQVTS